MTLKNWKEKINEEYYVKYYNKKKELLLILEAIEKDSSIRYNSPKWQVSVGGSVSRILLKEFYGRSAKYEAIKFAKEYMRTH